jgi:hypothetical protein
MNTKFNQWFEQAAADPVRRHTAIANLTKQRTILFCSAIVVTSCVLLFCFTPTQSASTPALGGFGAVMTWFIFFRVDSHRRVLTLLDHFSKDRDAKPLA